MSVAPTTMEGMDLLTAPLDDLLAQASQLVRDAAAGRMLERATEHELARQVSAIGDLARLTEALLVDAVGEITRRSEHGCRDDFMTSHLGCRNVTELVENLRTTLCRCSFVLVASSNRFLALETREQLNDLLTNTVEISTKLDENLCGNTLTLAGGSRP